MTAFFSRLLCWLLFCASLFEANALPSITWGYDALTKPSAAYDGSAISRFRYDSASTPSANEKENRPAGTSAVFARFLEFLAADTGATFGRAASTDYRATFLAANPELEGQVVVHHAVEQQVLTRYPGVVSEAEMHSLENLRGIPNAINSSLHLSQIRIEWNSFYRPFEARFFVGD
ncbi:MAG: hypothetical protein HY267_05175 [Deltaproteobacteria bacterium]|nr:hypothetical protein [Deltaproteobacteria bacterium]